MAISPNMCGELTSEELDSIKKIEKDFDSQLKQYYKGEPFVISADLNWVNLTPRARNQLIENYKSAGWIIEIKAGKDFGSTDIVFGESFIKCSICENKHDVKVAPEWLIGVKLPYWCGYCFEAWYDHGLTDSNKIREKSLELQKKQILLR